MIAPFAETPYVCYKPNQVKRERIPMQLYIDLIKYNGDEVAERDDADMNQSVGDLSRISLSSVGPSFAAESSLEASMDRSWGDNSISVYPVSAGAARKTELDDASLGEDTINSVVTASTLSTTLPSATKKHIRRSIRDITRQTEYQYMTAEYRPPKKRLIPRLWQRFVSGPFHDWKKRQAEARRHPVLKYYEQRVIKCEAQRIVDIASEMEEHAEHIQKAARRLAKLRASRLRVQSIQEKITGKHVEDMMRRDKQHQRIEYNMFYIPMWASESHVRREAERQREEEIRQLCKRAAEEKAEMDRVNAARQFELDFFENDKQETQAVNELMRKAGVVAGVNAPDRLPGNAHARVQDKKELIDAKPAKKKGKSVRIQDETDNSSAFDKHSHLLKGLGLKKTFPPISRKAKELVLNLTDSVDFTVRPKNKGRMPWHNAGGKSDGGNTMAVFDIDLSLYREVQVLRCERLGERGALCLAAEFVRGACPSLLDLNLNRCQITTRGFGRVLNGIRLARLDNLISLHLRGNQLGARSVEYIHSALEKGALSNVTMLDLRDNELNVEGAYALASLFFSGIAVTLRDVRIQRNNLGNEGFSHIVNVMRSIHDVKCPQLICLQIGENNATVNLVAEYAPYPSYIII